MKLYHGTSVKYLDKILKDGLEPRGKGKGNWKHTIDSHPDVIYLTNAYAIYFAHIAAGDGDDLVVLEIDTAKLNPLNLVPDEDFLEQATRKTGPAPIGKSVKVRTGWYRRRLRDFALHWKDSIEHLGTCGHFGPIPAKAITRYATLPDARRYEIIMSGMDPMISLANYRIVGDRYRNWIRWLFDDPLEGGPDESLPEQFRVGSDPGYMRNITRDGVTLQTI